MFKFEEHKCYRMPAHFGGSDFDPNADAYYNDVTGLLYNIVTDGDMLSNYIPECFELTKPELIIQYQQCREVEWMAGSFYNLVTFSAPVVYKGKNEKIEGSFALVLWENKTTPILMGNMMGMPKIYADIEDLHIFANTYRTQLSYEGNTFLQLEFTGPRPIGEDQVKALTIDINCIGWRYIPKVGGPGADLNQPILFPMRSEAIAAWIGTGTIKWTELRWDQNPRQCHIIKALADLPIIEISPVIMTKGRMILMEQRGRVLQ